MQTGSVRKVPRSSRAQATDGSEQLKQSASGRALRPAGVASGRSEPRTAGPGAHEAAAALPSTAVSSRDEHSGERGRAGRRVAPLGSVLQQEYREVARGSKLAFRAQRPARHPCPRAVVHRRARLRSPRECSGSRWARSPPLALADIARALYLASRAMATAFRQAARAGVRTSTPRVASARRGVAAGE